MERASVAQKVYSANQRLAQIRPLKGKQLWLFGRTPCEPPQLTPAKRLRQGPVDALNVFSV